MQQNERVTKAHVLSEIGSDSVEKNMYISCLKCRTDVFNIKWTQRNNKKTISALKRFLTYVTQNGAMTVLLIKFLTFSSADQLVV